MKRICVLVALLALLATVGVVAARPAAAGPAPSTYVCSGGTPSSPVGLPGGSGNPVQYTSVEVQGVCAVNAGRVVVTGDIVLDPGSALLADYANDAIVTTYASGLVVDGSVLVGSGATAVLGCDPVHYACFDAGNITRPVTVGGSVVATDPLGMVLHDTTVGGDVVSTGGGGGVTCTPDNSSVFSRVDSGIVYSDYEDLTVGGDLRVTGLQSCWIGVLRDTVQGSAQFSHDTYADPDADELLNNTIGGNFLCTDLTPAVHFGDAGQPGSTVGGYGTGDCAFARRVPYPNTNPVVELPIATSTGVSPGYWLAADDGGLFSFGVPFSGSAAGQGQAVGAVSSAPGGIGYQLASTSGSLVAYGAHPACTGGVSGLNEPIVGMAAAPGGGGCWTVASDGGIFTFGSNAAFYGSAGGIHLNEPIVGMAPTPSGDGYYLDASDGGIFAYGPGTTFQGSMGGQHLNQPIVGMAVDPATGGYWLVAADGGIFSFGAPFLGSLGAVHLNKPIVGMAAAPGGDGYYLVASDGGVFCFGNATYQGSTGSLALVRPIVGMALG